MRPWVATTLLLLLPPLSAGANTWSHLKFDQPHGRKADIFITKWIVDEEPIRYCVFIESGASVSPYSARVQIRTAIRNWLRALKTYDPDNVVFDWKGDPINVERVKIEEMNCSLVTIHPGYLSPKAVDRKGNPIPLEKFLSIYFTRDTDTAAFHDQSYFPWISSRGAPLLRLTVDDNPRIKVTARYVDLQTLIRKEESSRFPSILGEEVQKWVAAADAAGREEPYSLKTFCGFYGESNLCTDRQDSFTPLIHELGHAFGLGDDYEGGLKGGNDPNHMSAIPTTSAMNDCDLFFPTKDDVVGLSYLFDRLTGRNPDQRTFRFRNYPTERYARDVNELKVQTDPYDTPMLASGRRSQMEKRMAPDAPFSSWLNFSSITQDDLDRRILSELDAAESKSISIYDSPLLTDLSKVSGLGHLERLIVISSAVNSIPVSITGIPNLKELMISFSKLTTVPPEIAQLKGLEVLDLAGNRLAELPPEICDLENLEVLKLGGNPVRWLPEDLKEMPKLKLLNVDTNGFDDPKREMALIEELKAKGVKVVSKQ